VAVCGRSGVQVKPAGAPWSGHAHLAHTGAVGLTAIHLKAFAACPASGAPGIVLGHLLRK